MACCPYHDEGSAGWYDATRKTALVVQAKLARRGEVSYADTHLVARLRLGLLDEQHVACGHCGITDRDTRLLAALNWPAVPEGRLRRDGRGKIYSASPDDYLALCDECHHKLDSWRTALPLKAAESTAVIQNRQEP